MIAYSNAKINIGLNIKDKRPDGYHNLQSLFYPIPFCDIIEIIEAEKDSFINSGIQIHPTENLILRAVKLMREHYNFPAITIHIHKQIPLGSGLGGGSSNASNTLKLINQLFSLEASDDKLSELALRLGSDCPFFIQNKPSLVSGRGEIISPTDFTLKNQFIKLVLSDIHSSTAEAFSALQQQKITELRIDSNWTKTLTNDFEEGIFKLYPQLSQIKSQLLEEGAYYSSLTGTGSCVYGIYNFKPAISSQQEKIFKL